MQARILAWRQIKADLGLALHHHPVGPDIQITAVGVAGDHRVRGASITPAIQWPVPGNRQLTQVDLLSGQGVFVDRRIFPRYLSRKQALLEFVLHAADQLDRRRIRRLLECHRDALEARSQNIPKESGADRAFLEAASAFKQDCGRGLLLRHQVADRAHLLVAVHCFLYPDQFADLVDPHEPVTQVLNGLA